MTETPETTATTAREFTVTRTFAAPRDLVFSAWTDPRQVTHWWGPHDFTTPLSTISMDLRPGGTWRACMVSDADGTEYPTGGVFREVVPPERLVFTWSDPEAPDDPALESVVTVTFTDLGDSTEMTFHFAATRDLDGDVRDGWLECIERLAGHLART
jgi:uncharacterized protein YndB with AHSA1/START domain